MNAKKEEFKFSSNVDNLMISCFATIPDKEPIGIIQFAHGMCEHKERYEQIMNYYSSLGYVCVICDHRGHGTSIKSKKDLGYFYKGGYIGLIEDTHNLTIYAKKKWGDNIPFILVGHSMGSLIVRCYLKNYDKDIDALVISGSPSRPKGLFAGKILSSIITKFSPKGRSNLLKSLCTGPYDKKFKNENLANAWLSTDKDIVKAYNKSPLCGYKFTNQGYKNLIYLTDYTYDRRDYDVKNKSLPILFISGADDPCAISKNDFLKSIVFLNGIGYNNITYKLFDNMRHEIFNEIEKEKVYETLSKFIDNDVHKKTN